MKYITVLFYLVLSTLVASAQQTKPVYCGHIEYASGSFGGYNAPTKGDSIIVYMDDEGYMSMLVCTGNNISKPRLMDIDYRNLSIMNKKQYQYVASLDKVIKTNYFDTFYSYGAGYTGNSFYAITLTHFGIGDNADLNVMEEDNNRLRIECQFVASLKRIK
jgi:hypothetical protein